MSNAAKHRPASSLGEGTTVVHSVSHSVLWRAENGQNGTEGNWNWSTRHWGHLPTVPNYTAALACLSPCLPHTPRTHLFRHTLFSDSRFCIHLLGWLLFVLKCHPQEALPDFSRNQFFFLHSPGGLLHVQTPWVLNRCGSLLKCLSCP